MPEKHSGAGGRKLQNRRTARLSRKDKTKWACPWQVNLGGIAEAFSSHVFLDKGRFLFSILQIAGACPS
jgi:hypothetical protein